MFGKCRNSGEIEVGRGWEFTREGASTHKKYAMQVRDERLRIDQSARA
jgi:hypothetical protein